MLPDKSKNGLHVQTTYLRDLSKYPLPSGCAGETTNPEPNKCNNFCYRAANCTIQYIVQHHTVATFPDTINIFLTKAVSAHFVVDRSGAIEFDHRNLTPEIKKEMDSWGIINRGVIVEKLVDPFFRAYHAGVGGFYNSSKLGPDRNNDMNSWSIGIENVNNGNQEFPIEQIKTNLLLCDKLCDDIPSIEPKKMVGHLDWAMGRKIDPCIYFPWELYANIKEECEKYDITVKRNFGVFPKKTSLELKKDPIVIFENGKIKSNIDGIIDNKNALIDMQKLLQKYGYNIPDSELGIYGTQTQNALLSYNLHFNGEEIRKNQKKLDAWNKIVQDLTSQEAKEVLCVFNENDMVCLENVIEQF